MLLGYPLGENETLCPYITGERFLSENYLFEDASAEDMDLLLERGYRHFGKIFFRPVCRECHKCLPIRIPLKDYTLSRNAKRLFRRNAFLIVSLVERPAVSREKFELYKKHKMRFPEEKGDSETFEIFTESFFTNFMFSRTLEVRDKGKLVAVTHLDVGKKAVSAIYCYYDTDYLTISPGKFSIYKGISLAKELGKEYYYLGYYIRENTRMSYKGLYRPNQILLEENNWVSGEEEDLQFNPKYRLLSQIQ